MNIFNLKVKKLREDAIIPTRAHDTDLGIDLYSLEDHLLHPGAQHKFSLGIACELPEHAVFTNGLFMFKMGIGAFVWDKSSIGNKSIKTLGGVIEASYRGEWVVLLVNLSEEPVQFRKGQKLCQVVIAPVFLCGVKEVLELSETERGAGGFGSTGQ